MTSTQRPSRRRCVCVNWWIIWGVVASRGRRLHRVRSCQLVSGNKARNLVEKRAIIREIQRIRQQKEQIWNKWSRDINYKNGNKEGWEKKEQQTSGLVKNDGNNLQRSTKQLNKQFFNRGIPFVLLGRRDVMRFIISDVATLKVKFLRINHRFFLHEPSVKIFRAIENILAQIKLRSALW